MTHLTGWLIYKAGRGYYRPNACGYTNNPAEAGRYDFEDAMKHSHPNGYFGPRDGMQIMHESDAPNAGGVERDPLSEIIDGWGDQFDGTCWQCGGEGVVYDCFEEYACIDPEGGCDLCERRCDVCNPRRITLAHVDLGDSQ